MADFRINIGNGKVCISTYGSQEAAEKMMHDIILCVIANEICVERKAESWERLPT